MSSVSSLPVEQLFNLTPTTEQVLGGAVARCVRSDPFLPTR